MNGDGKDERKVVHSPDQLCTPHRLCTLCAERKRLKEIAR